MLTGPVTPLAGVKLIVPSGLTLTLPLVGLTTGLLTLSCALVLSGSVSLPFTLILLIGVLSGVVAVSATATGASLVPVMLTVSALLLVAPAVSFMV